MSANNSRANIKFNFGSARTERSRSQWRSRFFCVPLACRAPWEEEISPDNNSLSLSARVRVFSRRRASFVCEFACTRAMTVKSFRRYRRHTHPPQSPRRAVRSVRTIRATERQRANSKQKRTREEGGEGKRWRSKTSVQPRTQ